MTDVGAPPTRESVGASPTRPLHPLPAPLRGGRAPAPCHCCAEQASEIAILKHKVYRIYSTLRLCRPRVCVLHAYTPACMCAVASTLADAGGSVSAIDAGSPRQQVASLAEQMAAMARDKDKWDSAAQAVDDLRSVLHEHRSRHHHGAEGRPRSMMGFLSLRNGNKDAHRSDSAGVWNSLRRLRQRSNRRVSAEYPRPDDARPGESASASGAVAAGSPTGDLKRRPPSIVTQSIDPRDPPTARRRSNSPSRLSISPKSILRRQATSPPVLCLATDSKGAVLAPTLQSMQARSEKRLLASPPDAASPAGSRPMDQFSTGSADAAHGPAPDSSLEGRVQRLEHSVAQAPQGSRPSSGSVSPSSMSVRMMVVIMVLPLLTILIMTRIVSDHGSTTCDNSDDDEDSQNSRNDENSHTTCAQDLDHNYYMCAGSSQ